MSEQREPFSPRQTNTALYVQLHQAGFPAERLLEVQRAYRLACRLFNGRYRKTERAFLCHAVGAASAAARFDGRPAYVIAAMLHAAYDSGHFPDGRIGGASPAHRAWLEARVGAEVESILFRYARFGFEGGTPERLAREGFPDGDRDLVHLALVHELDDLLDLGLAFATKYGESIASRVDACAALAERVGAPELAAELRAAGRLYADTGWTEPLRSSTLSGFQIVPRAMAYLRHRVGHWRGKSVELH